VNGAEETKNVERWLRKLASEKVAASRAFKSRLVRVVREAVLRYRRRRWGIALRWATALVVLLGLIWLVYPRRTTVALLTVREGKATVHWQKRILFLFSYDGEEEVRHGGTISLSNGDHVVLSEDGAAVIAFQNGTVLELQPGTDLVLYQTARTMVTRIYLSAGELWAQVVHLLDASGRFEIQTPAAVVSVRGTVFRTRAQDTRSTYSATDEGTTEVTLLDAEQGNPAVEVPAGYEVEAVIGEPLVVRPQAPHIESLNLDGKETKLAEGETIASSSPDLSISGQTEPGVDVVLLFLLDGKEIDRAHVEADGTFTLAFHPPEEGDYALCLAAEDENGRRSDCVDFVFRYDRTPPTTLRLLEPTEPEVDRAQITLKGLTEAGAVLTLNGEPVPVADDGHFEVPLSLEPGANPLTLESCDAAGNCTRLAFTITRR